MEPSAEFGGYFMFHRAGMPIAGGMGDMGPDMPANDTWKIYLSTDDIAGVAAALESRGAEVVAPPMSVADLGKNMVFVDPTGARLGAWQPDMFPGFAAVDEPGAPGWFELFTSDYTARSSSTAPCSRGGRRSRGTPTSSGTRRCATRGPGRSAGRGDGRRRVPARGRPGPLVGVLGRRRRRRHRRRPDTGAGRCPGGRSDGHPLRADGHGGGPIGAMFKLRTPPGSRPGHRTVARSLPRGRPPGVRRWGADTRTST